MKALFLFIGCLLSVMSFSQFSVWGKIRVQANAAQNVSVELLTGADSSLLQTTLTDNEGTFTFQNVKGGTYQLRASMVGFHTSYTRFTIGNKDLKLDDMQLVSLVTALKGVTVTATKPFLEQKADKLIVNVENSPTSAGATALEVLQKVPGIIITSDKVSMVGKSHINIMIDGRSSPYADMAQVLRDMPASNIEKIEVISDPGAKYDASGGAVINLILKRNANLGTNGNVILTVGRGLYGKGDPFIDRNFYRLIPSLSLNHRSGRVNAYGSYNYISRNDFEQSSYGRQIGDFRFLQTNYAPNQMSGHTFRVGLDYYINKKNTVGFLVNGFDRRGDVETRNLTEQTRILNEQMISSFTTQTAQAYKRTNLSTNVNWKHSFDSLGRELNIDMDYARFQLDNESDIRITQTNGTASVNNQLVDNPVQFGVLKLDYVHPLDLNNKVEFGWKSTLAQIDNFLTFSRNGKLDPLTSNDFLYGENIHAAYLNYATKLKSWEFTGGLRAEQTIAGGKSGGIKNCKENTSNCFLLLF